MTAGGMANLGKWVAPPRFILFVVLLVAGSIGAGRAMDWLHGIMIGFDVAALVFLLSCIPLLRDSTAAVMRRHAAQNDANRLGLLALTGLVTVVVLVTVGAELLQSRNQSGAAIALIVGTLALSWLFSNVVYAFHYAHMFYLKNKGKGGDSGGIEIPGTGQPDYWDFLYFSFTLGMTFQTSDTQITSGRYRRVATFHCFAAFVFNIGVLAFTINVLGGGGGG
jgi:uncharacterized membrane protein